MLARDTRDGRFAGGMTMLVGGIVTSIAGALLWPLGCSDDKDTGETRSPGLCTAGPFIVGGGVALIVGGGFVMGASGPYSEVEQSSAAVDLTPLGVAYRAKNGVRGVVGPGFAVGQF